MVALNVDVAKAIRRKDLMPFWIWRVLLDELKKDDDEKHVIIVKFDVPPEILDRGKPDVIFDYIEWVLGTKSPLPLLSQVPCDRAWTKKVWNVFNDFVCGCYSEYPETTWTTVLCSCSAELYENAMLDWMMRRSVFAVKNVSDPYAFLVTPKQVRKMPKMEPINLLNGGILRARTMLPKHAAELEEPDFDRVGKYCAILKKEIPDMPWLAAAAGSAGLVLAGGRLVAALYGKDYRGAQDVDLFLVSAAKHEQQALADGERMAQRAVDAISKAFCGMRVVTTVNNNVTNVFVYEPVPVSRGIYSFTTYKRIHKFQIIRTVFPTPSHIVHGFDVDVCGILWDGAKIFCTQNAARAIVNGFVLYDENKLSTTAESRYAKYALRYGLGIMVAGAPQRKINGILQTISKFYDKKTFFVDCLRNVPLTTNSVRYYFSSNVSRDQECPRVLENAIMGRKRHDLFGVLHHMLKQTYISEDKVSDYDDDLMSIIRANDDKVRKNNLKYRLACDGKGGVFTGAFNPVEAHTLAGLADIYGP